MSFSNFFSSATPDDALDSIDESSPAANVDDDDDDDEEHARENRRSQAADHRQYSHRLSTTLLERSSVEEVLSEKEQRRIDRRAERAVWKNKKDKHTKKTESNKKNEH